MSDLERVVGALDLDELARQRWFAGKDRRPVSASLVDAFALPGEAGTLLLVDIVSEEGEHDRYVLAAGADGEIDLPGPAPASPFWAALVELVAEGGELAGTTGTLIADAGLATAAVGGGARHLTDDQSNTSVVLGERLVVKCYRRVLAGRHPEPELLAALTRAGAPAPGYAGSLVRRSDEGEEAVACLYGFVAGDPVGWEPLVARVERALADHAGAEALSAELGELGRTAAELHVALASELGVRFADESDGARLLDEGRARFDEALAVTSGELAELLASLTARIERALADCARVEGSCLTRVHGDLHVAQIVASPGGAVVVDFEGEPGKPLAERRREASPLRDLACLLLSFDHVAVTAARRLEDDDALGRALAWSASARARAAAEYRARIAGSPLSFDPLLLRALAVEKELHEAVYAATMLPEWSYAPATVLPRLLERPDGAA